jgi:hypothetical protein
MSPRDGRIWIRIGTKKYAAGSGRPKACGSRTLIHTVSKFGEKNMMNYPLVFFRLFFTFSKNNK